MRYLIGFALLLLTLCSLLIGVRQAANAQSSDGLWTDFENISETPFASSFPTIVADGSGTVHVLWSEDVGGLTSALQFNFDGSPSLDSRGNQINYLYDLGNTLYYTRWDSDGWHEPIDVEVNPNGRLEYQRAVVDQEGILHVIWVANEAENVRLYYSRVHANQAYFGQDWSQPVVLAEHTHMEYYPIDITVDLTDDLHILYAQLGNAPGAYIINSFDGGDTWSEPIAVFMTQDPNGRSDGVSTTKIITDQKNRLHAAWTLYNEEGNGKAIYYSQSIDNGKTWSKPFEVAAWQPGWYETDWLSPGVIGDEVHLVWLGGQRAFLNERISQDGGQTWGENHRILPNLIGENGFASLAVDSSNRMHLMIVQRGLQAPAVHGIWYANWDKGQWTDPEMLGTRNFLLYWKLSTLSSEEDASRALQGTFTGGGLRYQMATILNGNKLFVAVVNEFDGDIWSSHAILPAPLIAPQSNPQLTATPTEIPEPTPEEVTITPTPLPTKLPSGGQAEYGGQSTMLLLGIVPAMLIIVAFVVYLRLFKRS